MLYALVFHVFIVIPVVFYLSSLNLILLPIISPFESSYIPTLTLRNLVSLEYTLNLFALTFEKWQTCQIVLFMSFSTKQKLMSEI